MAHISQGSYDLFPPGGARLPPTLVGLTASRNPFSQFSEAHFKISLFFQSGIHNLFFIATEPMFDSGPVIIPIYGVEDRQINYPVHHSKTIEKQGDKRFQACFFLIRVMVPHSVPQTLQKRFVFNRFLIHTLPQFDRQKKSNHLPFLHIRRLILKILSS